MNHTLPLSTRAETTALKQPKELFSYSRNADGGWQTDDKEAKLQGLNYFYFPDAYVDKNISLQAGLGSFKKIPDAQNTADFPLLLRCLQQHEQTSGKKVRADIISFRGVMTRLLTLPYDLNSEIHLHVLAYDGQIFLKNDDELDLKKRAAEQQRLGADAAKEKHLRTCEYGGYKFEAVATLPRPWAHTPRAAIEKRHKKVVSNYEQYISVVRTGVGRVKTLLAGEVDCVWDYLPDNAADVLAHYAELKTSRVVETPQQAAQFEKKLFRTWAQCFLLGVPRMVYGFRDDNYVLRDVEVYRTEEVPLMIKDSAVAGRSGAPLLCTNALRWYGAVLDWLVQTVDVADERSAYKLDYDPGSRSFMLSECVGDENRRLRHGGILTPEFTAWRETLRGR
ncbi:RAI1-domain-containing protein [Metschnikowia bicuspidata var. bicuspidata NRRL YB-4993]|uniref:Decapping nuclease n=1 Tax=Metschnikowia bicuspidata var. bicuspidata NRRL YB-4993 TaxID=869754 RepID=A0A1A0HEE2_9ASCO|nr:RAI1-domain-containing protein [Metschnikowia bicuspidata var. bicuspidata NRRL YB-4993]OBA22355.1 RAI1-domain-containing protein [Metschnikowia bicuspidata var. bicuspidata NRRL YB-4993]